MASTYITKDGDAVDAIAFAHYGRHGGTTEAVYEANRGLAAQGPVLPAGVEIVLPDLPAEAVPVGARPVRLYD